MHPSKHRTSSASSSNRAQLALFVVALVIAALVFLGLPVRSAHVEEPFVPVLLPSVAMWPPTVQFNSTITLPSGQEMPLLGFGLAALGSQSEEVIRMGLRNGMRLFDTASEKAPWYRNEAILGRVLSDPSAYPPNVTRKDIFVTTKLFPADLGYEKTAASIDASRASLRVDTIDLFLIHFPFCHGQPDVPAECGKWQDSWRAMEDALVAKKVRNIGVSNFEIAQLNELDRIARQPIAVVQNWADPWHQANDIRTWCDSHNAVFQAYSLLGTQWQARYPDLKQNPVTGSARLQALAARYNVTPQVTVLRWALQHKIAVIPRSTKESHVRGYKQIFDFNLDDDDLVEFNSLNGQDPRRML